MSPGNPGENNGANTTVMANKDLFSSVSHQAGLDRLRALWWVGDGYEFLTGNVSCRT